MREVYQCAKCWKFSFSSDEWLHLYGTNNAFCSQACFDEFMNPEPVKVEAPKAKKK